MNTTTMMHKIPKNFKRQLLLLNFPIALSSNIALQGTLTRPTLQGKNGDHSDACDTTLQFKMSM